MDVDTLATELAEVMATVGFSPLSATIYGSVAAGTADQDSDIDVVCVVDEQPGEEVLLNCEDLLDHKFEAPVNITLLNLREAHAHSVDPGHPLTSAVGAGVHITGAPLPDLLPEASTYDERAAAERAHERSAARVQQLRNQDLHEAPGDSLALALESAANAALLHHGLGRFKTAGQRMAKSTARLEGLIGVAESNEVAQLYRSLKSQLDRPPPATVETVETLIELPLDRASAPEAPGSTTLA